MSGHEARLAWARRGALRESICVHCAPGSLGTRCTQYLSYIPAFSAPTYCVSSDHFISCLPNRRLKMSSTTHSALDTPPPSHSHQHHNAPSTPEPTGAAQFITNLSERQRAHLQFAVPSKDAPDRFSHFLEEPRKTPVPNRFTFDALDSDSRKARDSSSTGSKASSKLGCGDTTKSTKSTQHAREDSGSGSDGGTSRSRSRTRSRAASSVPSLRPSVDLLKEVEHLKEVVEVVDWRFYATGVCMCLVNLVMAWDATAISIALPVSLGFGALVKQY